MEAMQPSDPINAKGWVREARSPFTKVTKAGLWSEFCSRWGQQTDEDAATGMVNKVFRFAAPDDVLEGGLNYQHPAVVVQTAQVVDFLLTQAERDHTAKDIAMMARRVLVNRIINFRLPLLVPELVPTHLKVLRFLQWPLVRPDLIPYAHLIRDYFCTVHAMCESSVVPVSITLQTLAPLRDVVIMCLLNWGMGHHIIINSERVNDLKELVKTFRSQNAYVWPAHYRVITYVSKAEQLLFSDREILRDKEADKLIDALAFRLLSCLEMKG